ncbi:MAG: hypothetical protein ABFD82_05705 [Syntrophaceae bacterium]
MKNLIIAIISILVLFSSTSSFAWLIYTKPEFRGKVIDEETKDPIEGAVVVVLYKKWEFGGPGGGNTLPMDSKETLTDKNGEFYFPAYSTLIGPLSRVSDVSFIIFKPGYMSVKRIDGINIPEEKYFNVKKDLVGKEGEITYVDRWERTFSYKGPLGIVELKKTKPNESMSGSMPSDYSKKDLPLLYKAIEEDDIIRGLLPKGGRKE